MSPRVLVLASTFPRFRGDHVGRFLGEYVEALELPVTVLAPGTRGAADHEVWSEHVEVHRFEPSWPEIAYGGGIPDNLRARPWTAAAVPGFAMRWVRAALPLADACDVIDAHWAVPGGLVGAVVARRAMRPMRLVLHSGGVHALARLPASQRWARTLAGGAAQVTAVSGELAARFGDLCGTDVEVASCPMGIAAQAPIPAELLSGVAFRGRLVPVKGVDVLIDACGELDVPLVVAGDGPERAALEKHARRLAVAVEFLGATSTTPPAAVCAFPSRTLAGGRTEGLPVSLLEAMASGAAVVASDVGGIREVVSDGANGCLVSPDDASALTAAIKSLLDDPAARARLGAQAREDASRFLWSAIGPRHREHLCRAASA